ncbi:MAG: ABC transporter permease [Actinomycetaceae bacterium]|nr:ABC transporter permease [Actinomycetaceae bacterium]MDY6083602.1 ABC transporter permease [Actinomycetaceae bacterium]
MNEMDMNNQDRNVALNDRVVAGPDVVNVAVPTREEAVSQGSRQAEKHLSMFALYRRRFMRNKPAVAGLIIFVVLAFFAVFGNMIGNRWTFEYLDFTALTAPPSPRHWFGTTVGGNDLYAQVIHGLGRSLIIALVVSIVTTAISAFVGAAAAFLGGTPEKIILTIIHFMLIIPSFLLIAMLVAGSGGDWKILIGVMILFGWMYQARVIWSLAISIREREYVTAARFMGVPGWKIISKHIVPNIGSLLIINATLGVVSTVMSETGLSFLGLGVQLPDVSLGNLLTAGAASVQSAPWIFFFPAGVLMLLTVSMALIADGLRDALDPNSSAGGQL